MSKISVLVVDDAAFTRDLMKKGVRSVFPNFKIEEAVDGKQAKNRLTKGLVDLVLCDWEMPEMSGDELLEWIRGNEATKAVPFIMVTSRGDKEHVMKAVELGANNYVVKPFTTEKLVDVIAKVLTKAKGISIKALVAAGSSNAHGGMVNESASVLLGAQQKGPGGVDMGLSGAIPIAGSYTSADQAKNAPTNAPGNKNHKISGKVIAQVRLGELAPKCLVREISTEAVTAVIRREGGLPTILDLAVFDFIRPDGEGEANINGYVHMLQARDPSQETEFVNIEIRFIDDDADKRAQLQHYIDSITG